jgi:flagellar biosynthesis protein FlhF
MSVLRFVGANSREAMRQVRAALGDEALILANRRTEQGVEILAMAESAAPSQPDEPQRPKPTAPAPAAPTPAAAASSEPAQAFEAMSARLLEEMRDMRALLSRDRGQPEATGTIGEQLVQVMLEAGFGQALAEEIVAALPEEVASRAEVDERAMSWLARQLVKRLEGLDDEAAFMDRAGIVALIGPTGVGKTTTTAKLSARYVMRHGTRPVALVTTDSFRIGAHEQLRIYSRLLDVPMYALNADQPVSDLLERMKGKSWIIIDTVGMSQRDHRVIEQVGHLRGGGTSVRLVLLLNAASQPETLEEVVVRYRQAAQAAGGELVDCIITKQDEAGRLAPVLDIVMRHGLRLLFVSHGQRVPEDMALAEPAALIEQCLASRVPLTRSASRPTPTEPAGRGSGNLLGQGRRLATVLQALRQRLPGFDGLESVWNMLGLPTSIQQQRLDALLANYPQPGQALGMLWSERRRVPGERWAMPDVALSPEGTWLALPLLQHRQVAGQQARLEAAFAQYDIGVHLLSGLPDGEAGNWLERQEQTWCSQVRGSLRVEYGGERQTLAGLENMAETVGEIRCRFRGAAMDLRAELLGLGGGRRRRRDVALLESLIQLFLVRDAIRHLGLGERETG